MSVDRNAPSPALNPPIDSSPADRLRTLLRLGCLSQRAAARKLDVNERLMRQWCAGQGTPPPWVFRALSPRLTRAEYLEERIATNLQRIEALQDGHTGDPAPSDPALVAQEITHLQRENEEHASLARLERALDRRQEAFAALMPQWLPRGNGQPTMESCDELDAALEEVRAAQSEMERIVLEIRAGLR